ncbi:MAG: hypothetical protein Kow00124_13770 [Anaerolineae bacterium]
MVSTECGDVLLLEVHNLMINELAPEIGQPSNEVQLVVLLANDEQVSEFNYHVRPLSAEAGTRIPQDGRFHAAIEIGNGNPVYVSLMVLDNDELSQSDQLVASLAEALAGALVEAAGDGMLPGLGMPLGLAAEYGIDRAVEGLEEPDIIGSFAFEVGAYNDWGQGMHQVESPDEEVVIDFSIRRYQGCSDILVLADGRPASAEGDVCPPSTAVTRLAVGSMAVISVPPGRHLFFREGPGRDYDGIRYESGHLLRIIEGPQCDEDVMFWKAVDRMGREGWAAESRVLYETGQPVYFLLPVGTQG